MFVGKQNWFLFEIRGCSLLENADAKFTPSFCLLIVPHPECEIPLTLSTVPASTFLPRWSRLRSCSMLLIPVFALTFGSQSIWFRLYLLLGFGQSNFERSEESSNLKFDRFYPTKYWKSKVKVALLKLVCTILGFRFDRADLWWRKSWFVNKMGALRNIV